MTGWARLWAAVAAVLAVFLGVTVAMASDGTAPAAPSAAPGAAAAVAAGPYEVTLTEFAIEPAELTLPAGETAQIQVRNEGQVEHDFSIEGVAQTEMIPAGEQAVLEVPALEPGTYETLCTVAGHAGAGMVGTLVVGEAAAVTVAEPGDAHAGHAAMTPEEMVRKHEDPVAEYPVATEGKGGVDLEPTIAEDGTKVFEITASEIDWEVEPGVFKEALAYNGMIPGPQINVNVGDTVRIEFTNELSDPSAVHFHGLLVPNDMDGVPGLNQASVLPGESFTYEFEVRNAGSHMYHSHFDSANQVTKGLLGAFIVHDDADPEVDIDYTMVLGDGPLGYHINGKGFPATEPIVARFGDTIRIRYMNEGLQIHPMHLHGIAQQVIAKDGYPLPQPYTADTVMVAPGERVDVLVEANEPGPWAFHCHVLNHAEAAEGMFGMVTALIVEDA